MLEKHGRSIMIIANIVIAVTAVLTLIALVIVGIFWLGELNSDVERNQQSIVEVRQDIKDVRQELKTSGRNLSGKLKTSEMSSSKRLPIRDVKSWPRLRTRTGRCSTRLPTTPTMKTATRSSPARLSRSNRKVSG